MIQSLYCPCQDSKISLFKDICYVGVHIYVMSSEKMPLNVLTAKTIISMVGHVKVFTVVFPIFTKVIHITIFQLLLLTKPISY